MENVKSNTGKRGRRFRREEDGPIEPRSYRIGKRERFGLRVLSRQTNVDTGVILEELIRERCDKELVASKLGKHWLELADLEDGAATLTLLALPRYRPSDKEQRIKAFAAAHAPFFYADDAQQVPHDERLTVLWPMIDHLTALWFKTRTKDVWGVAKEMAAALKAAGASVPAGRGKW